MLASACARLYLGHQRGGPVTVASLQTPDQCTLQTAVYTALLTPSTLQRDHYEMWEVLTSRVSAFMFVRHLHVLSCGAGLALADWQLHASDEC